MYINHKGNRGNNMQILKEKVRNAILTSAAAEFNEKGFENASMRQIASKAGITPGNIYRYFANKEDIRKAIIEPIMTELDQILSSCSNGKIGWNTDLTALLQSNESFELDLRQFSDKFVALYHKNENGMIMLAKEQSYRVYFKEWLNSLLFAYFSNRKKTADANIIKIMSSISSVLMIDSIIESMSFQAECRQMNIAESEIMYQCISVIMGAEASKL